MKTAFAWILTVFTLALCSAARAGDEKKDVILFKDGTQKSVDKVEEENYASVTYSVGGRSVKARASRVSCR